ncbi:MAG TPA: type I methionyl aminopeptidase [Candidatus Paceibacterota bacterium]|nr:type I methionyl aminopeptidase [Candidatus Paceibacterota bacterium]
MVTFKTSAEIELMAQGGAMLAAVLKRLGEETKPGVQTIELDVLARKLIIGAGAKPAFLNYRPAGAKKAYPYTLCVSVNDVVVHGQPSKYKIREGDIVSLDLGLEYKGFYLDSAITVPVGDVGKQGKKLIEVTRESLMAGVKAAKPGHTLGDIGAAIEKTIVRNKFSVVEGLTGHGIGRDLHEDPTVFNFGRKGQGEELVPGMVLAIEPMVAIGTGAIRQLLDESYGTADGERAAHFEHTVAITEKGPRILTML